MSAEDQRGTGIPPDRDVPSIAVLDHGSGNLRSATRALTRAGAQVWLTDDPEQAAQADGLVVPGVGAFASCMAGLRRVGGVELVRHRVAEGRPVLGICVGFQVLFTAGIEHGERTEGIGVLTGEVGPLVAPRVPHMGWNTVAPAPSSRLFEGATDHFYFVHSYGVVLSSGAGITATTGAPVHVSTAQHGGGFVAAIESGPLAGTQFHPEKSADAGARLLRRWVATLRTDSSPDAA